MASTSENTPDAPPPSEETPVETTNEETPVKRTSEEAPVKRTSEETPVKRTSEETPVKRTNEERTSKTTNEETTTRTTNEETTTRTTTEETRITRTEFIFTRVHVFYSNKYYWETIKSIIFFLFGLKIAQECYHIVIPIKDYEPFKGYCGGGRYFI